MLATRAQSKLEEARFFLRLLARTKGRLPRAGFYASATVQALRSVTWVLQADLRPSFGARFNQWWEVRRTELSDGGAGFPVVRNARNATTKHGSPLVRQVRRAIVETGPVRAVSLLIDPGHETAANFRLEFDRPLARVDLDTADPSESVVASVQDMEHIIEAIRVFGDGWARGEGSLETEFSGGPPLAFAEAVAILSAYASDLTLLLEDAQEEFAT